MKSSIRSFVTGGSGFIGQHLVRRLVEQGQQVRCLVRSDARAKSLRALEAEPVRGDLLDAESLRALVAGCDYVFHLAGVTKGIGGKTFFEVNVGGVTAVGQACARQPTPPRLVFVSSLAAIGPSPDGQPVTEELEPRPVSCYGRSKLAAEKSLRQFASAQSAAIVRPPIVLGEHDPNGMFLFQGIARSGIHFVPTFRRHSVSIIHVDDLVSAIWEIAARGKSLNQDDRAQGVYHVASNEAPRYSELGQMIGRAVGRKRVVVIPIASPVLKMAAACNELRSRLSRVPQVLNWDKAREATVGPWLCSNRKVLTELQFRVEKPLQDRLTQTAQWYSEQGFFRIRGH